MIASINPATGTVIKKFKETSKKEVNDAIERARKAQQAWAAKSRGERILIIGKLAEILKKRAKKIGTTVKQEVGYSLPTEMELEDIIAGIDYYTKRYAKINDINMPVDPRLQPNTQAWVEFVPQGVIGHIGIWNYPFWQTMITAIPALLAGNAIVYKPSEYVTLTGLKIEELIHEAGVPKDVYITVVGGKDVGKMIVKSNVDAITFTGGIDTGEYIVKNAGIKPLILELGGNDPAIVCQDANIGQAAKGIAYGTFVHAGQSCIRTKRVYVVKSIADKFLKEFTHITQKLSATMPMIRADARAKVHKAVQAAIKKGAKLLFGGKLPEGKGFYYPNTALLLPHDNFEVIQKETFGPVCSIRIVKDQDEAVKLANASQYGLGASVWTQNFTSSLVARKIQAGTVWINTCQEPLICGEYNQGWKKSSIPTSQDRLMMFLKKKANISHIPMELRPWWPQ